MGNLIKAEFRKVLTTKLWWGLLIPTFVLSFAWSLGVGALIDDVSSNVADEPILRQVGLNTSELPWAIFALTRSINIAMIFPMIFGALGLATELHRKTITTSFLTASSRSALLTAKAITYALWGAIFGLVITLSASLGTVLAADSSILPGFGDWLLIVLAGLIAAVLWTLLGLGVGALIGAPVGTLVLLLIYALIIGPIAELVITGISEGGIWAGLMPNGAGNGLTGSTAGQVIVDTVRTAIENANVMVNESAVDALEVALRIAAGAPGAMVWWASGLVFLAWSLALFGAGMLRNQKRDIT
ncbi:ABC-2 type transport system permease protein [Tamaricihabitans halophyticus]|uniref:ABC-2 type transport system permease protein n=1 Tax=Tamaricihabitans halophyticus TaxID=1262583 RepID=A0A4R2QQP7_9PSEU|nr:ABC transporter permease subunit [Tamaricihabitans halophyticus]TCP51927.1 ABC-2 type transport system permease protein [Tamaricihabitans halophyticus]